ncbi:RecT-like ssDNA annealing protein [Cellulophaga phage phi13:2]|uniref:RecT family protein n=1 Tax=Cellulophaga phage phi13:2 TaxID=1328030 RepID=S0A5N7_9CAUD|nr:RecT-like ssDNA annealing protein [Cellulophaga phage phi13:2]AGO49628.1 RecT family protein [Cellulophaga phage phi13:2]
MSTETKKTTAVATKEKDITAIVLNKINTFKQSGELRLPKDYSAENALKSAYLVLNESLTRDKKPVLTACSQGSIANALLKMVVWGVSPLKGQIYFVPYGDKLEASVSYLGNVMMAKRYGKLKTIKANCIMKGDEFEFEIVPETGLRRIVKHKQTLQSIGSDEIIGAYAAFELVDGTMDVEIMNMDQIKKSWNQGATNGGSPAHKNFPDQMAQRTVLNRACKMLIRSSDDKVLYDDVDNEIDVAKEDVKHAISENANTDVIDIEHEEETTDDVDTITGEIIDKKF